jgi:hypothetical protein
MWCGEFILDLLTNHYPPTFPVDHPECLLDSEISIEPPMSFDAWETLRKAGITIYRELAVLKPHEIRQIRGIGKVRAEAIRRTLASLDLWHYCRENR